MRIKKYFTEGIGTFLLIFIGLSAIAFLKDPLTIAFAFGLIYLVLLYSFGNISGCHFNPAVSLSYVIMKKITIGDFFGYCGSQIVGGLLGGLFFRIILPTNYNPFFSHATEYCCNGDPIAAVFVEIIISYLFILTFLGANSKSRNKNVRGLIIAAGEMIALIATSILTYSAVNPIKALAGAIYSNNWSQFAIFFICPFIGSVLATFNFSWLQKKPEDIEEIDK